MKTNSISEYISSHEYFSCAEQAVFQTVQATKEEDWYDLSGPVEWWKENYDFKKYDWNVTNDIQKIKKYEMALKMMFEQEKPENVLDWIQFTETEFAISKCN